MVVGAMVSSSARGFVLGEATALSNLGEPLRVVIPVSPSPRETVAAECISLVRTAGDGLGDVVTAKVSLERPAAGPRLLVTTAKPIFEQALRISIDAGCQAPTRSSFALLLEPATDNSSSSAATAEANAPRVRAPGQERSAAFVPAAARRDPPDSSGIGAARYAQRPVGMDSGRLAPAIYQYTTAAPASKAAGSVLQVASVTETVRVPVPVTRPDPLPSSRPNDNWWTIVIAVSGLAAIVLGAILVRAGRTAPRTSPVSGATTRSATTRGGPRSVSSSVAVATLAQTGTPLLTRAAPTTRSWVTPATPVTMPNLTTSRGKTVSRPATISSRPLPTSRRDEQVLDSLMNEIDGDLNVETAVRRVHAAAQGSLGSDIGSDAILKAIEAAERDLLMAAPAPAEAAMGHSLDDELLGKRNKAA
jgi:hypothetical protein